MKHCFTWRGDHHRCKWCEQPPGIHATCHGVVNLSSIESNLTPENSVKVDGIVLTRAQVERAWRELNHQSYIQPVVGSIWEDVDGNRVMVVKRVGTHDVVWFSKMDGFRGCKTPKKFYETYSACVVQSPSSDTR